jgi:hypothetical protein
MSKELVAWSYSRLSGYETCPKKFYEISVSKRVKDPPNEHSSYGDFVHKSIAKYMQDGGHLPLTLRQYEKYLAPIRAAPGEKVVEQKITLDSAYQQTDWFSKAAFLRVISDLTQLNGASGVVWDWKTGKPVDDFTQLKLTGAVTFLLAEELEELTLAYFWLKTKQVAATKMKREDCTSVWNEILPRVQRYQEAHEQLDFPARPSYLCRYCPVKSCPFNETK